MVDIAIIGGGVIGLSLAHALLCEDVSVMVIDAGPEIPAATNAAAGMLAPSFEMAAGGDALYELSTLSLSLWADFAGELEQETGQRIDFRTDGVLGVALDEAGVSALRADFEPLKQRGAPVEMYSGNDARALEPALSRDVAAALWARDDAQVDPRKLLAALRMAVAQKVGQFLPARVVKARKKSFGFTLTLADGAVVEAAAIVLASGAAATCLIEDLPPPPISPVKGEAAALAMNGASFRRVVRAPGAYLCPKAGGRLIIGATQYHHRDDLGVDDHAIKAMIANGAKAVPAISGFKELERWAGLRPATPDGAPILGCDTRGPEAAFLALGHHRNGVLLAPASAKALAAEILAKPPVINLNPFRPERFAAQRYD